MFIVKKPVWKVALVAMSLFAVPACERTVSPDERTVSPEKEVQDTELLEALGIVSDNAKPIGSFFSDEMWGRQSYNSVRGSEVRAAIREIRTQARKIRSMELSEACQKSQSQIAEAIATYAYVAQSGLDDESVNSFDITLSRLKLEEVIGTMQVDGCKPRGIEYLYFK